MEVCRWPTRCTRSPAPFSGGNDNCVEFGVVGDLVAMRDSKRAEQTSQVYTRDDEPGFTALRLAKNAVPDPSPS